MYSLLVCLGVCLFICIQKTAEPIVPNLFAWDRAAIEKLVSSSLETLVCLGTLLNRLRTLNPG